MGRPQKAPFPAPSAMAAGDRLEEVAAILAAGLLRLRNRPLWAHNEVPNNPLDFGAEESVHRPVTANVPPHVR